MVMKKKALNQDIQKSFSKSKGRFISIACLIALGSFALVGLQVTGPDMRKTTSDYLQQYHAADLSVIGSMGIDQENAKTIDSLDGTEQVTYGYLKDVVLKDTSESCRIFSLDEDISKYEVISGRLPEKADEIAFADADKDNYQIGDQITFEEKADTSGNTVLKNKTFTITGFVHSTEILSCVNQGQSTAGSGELNSYAVVTEDAFDCDYYMIARITFRDTQGLDPYSDAYTDKIQAHKNQLETLLEDAPHSGLMPLGRSIRKRLTTTDSRSPRRKRNWMTPRPNWTMPKRRSRMLNSRFRTTRRNWTARSAMPSSKLTRTRKSWRTRKSSWQTAKHSLPAQRHSWMRHRRRSQRPKIRSLPENRNFPQNRRNTTPKRLPSQKNRQNISRTPTHSPLHRQNWTATALS